MSFVPCRVLPALEPGTNLVSSCLPAMAKTLTLLSRGEPAVYGKLRPIAKLENEFKLNFENPGGYEGELSYFFILIWTGGLD